MYISEKTSVTIYINIYKIHQNYLVTLEIETQSNTFSKEIIIYVTSISAKFEVTLKVILQN